MTVPQIILSKRKVFAVILAAKVESTNANELNQQKEAPVTPKIKYAAFSAGRVV